MRRFHQAVRDGRDEVVIWGSGTPRREFLHVDDMAEASLFVFDLPVATYHAHTRPMQSHINVGTGEDISIQELAELMAAVTGFSGRITFDLTMPDGTPRKLLDVSRLGLMGWKASILLRSGIEQTYRWFVEHQADLRQA